MSVPLIKYPFKLVYKKKDENGEEIDAPLLYCLRRKPESYWLYTEEDVAKEAQEATTLTVGDMTHALRAFMNELRKMLVRGDRVKIADLGTFYMNICSDSVEDPEELTVRHIKRVNIRFLPDKALKLVNNATATTRSDNNVSFAIVSEKAETGKPVDPAPGTGEEDDDYVDPGA